MSKAFGVTVLALGVLALAVVTAESQPPRPGGPPRGEKGPGGRPGPDGAIPPPPPSPLMEALDTNRDGTLSAEEIKNAPAALLKLDKNRDGRLTPDELQPAPGPDGPPPPDDRPGGPPPRDGRRGGPEGPPPGRPEPGMVIPPFVRNQLQLTAEQQRQLA